jgi:Cdc6-like AAA superfamily ATPase
VNPTPFIPPTPADCLTLLSHCHAALDISSAPEQILSRSTQFQKIFQFLSLNLEQHSSDALYIAGSPGTGKSLCVERVLSTLASQYKKRTSPIITTLNAMSLRESKQCIGKLLQSILFAFDDRNASSDKFLQELNSMSSEETLHLLQEIIAPSTTKLNCKLNLSFFTNSPLLHAQFQKIQSNRSIIMVIDEVDALLSHSHTILKQLLSFSSLPSSRLLLVMISNCIEVSDKVEPDWIDSGAKFSTLVFPSYSQEDLQTIVEERLLRALQMYLQSTIDVCTPCPIYKSDGIKFPMFEPFALHLCCMKIASRSGDARTALDLCRQGVSALISQIQSTVSPCILHQPISSTDFDLYAVSMRHMSRLLNSSFNASTETIGSLTDQQKLILLTLASERILNDRDPSFSQFFVMYRNRASYFKVPHIAEREVRDILGYLESLGLIVLKKEKGVEKSGNRASRGSARHGSASALDDKCLSLAVQVDDLRFHLNEPFWVERWYLFDKLTSQSKLV